MKQYRILRAMLVLVLISAGLLTTLIGTLHQYPQLLFNGPSLRWLNSHVLARLAIDLRFASIDFAFTHDTFWQRTIRIRSQNFVLQTATVQLNTPSFDALIGVDLQPRSFGLTRVGPLQIKGLTVQVTLDPIDKAQISEPAASQRFTQQLQRIAWYGPLQLDSKQASLRKGQDRVTTGSTEIRVDTPPNHNFRIHFKGEQLLAHWERSKLQAPRVEARAELEWNAGQWRILALGPVEARDMRAALFLAEQPDDKVASSWDLQHLFATLEQLSIKPIAVQFHELRVKQGQEPTIGGRLQLELQRPNSDRWKLSAQAEHLEGLPLTRGKVDLTGSLPHPGRSPAWGVSLRGSGFAKDLGSLQVQGKLSTRGERAEYTIQGRVQKQAQTFRLRAQGSSDGRNFHLVFDGSALGLDTAVPSIKLSPCSLKGTLTGSPMHTLSSQWDCKLALKRSAFASEARWPVILPQEQEWTLKGPLSLKNLDRNPQLEARLDLAMPTWKNASLSLDSSLQAKIQGPLQHFDRDWKVLIQAEASARIDSFQALAKQLAHSPLEIPAPLHTLDGTVLCEVSAQIDLLTTVYQVPLRCKSDLGSSVQALRWTAQGELLSRPQQKSLLTVDISLDQIALELPKMVLGDPLPQLLRDKRLAPPPLAKQNMGELPFDWSIKVGTPADHKIMLSSNLLKSPLPLAIELVADNTRPDGPHLQGTVELQSYQLSLMKKKAFVDTLGLRLEPEQDTPTLYGLIRFEDADTRMALRLSGTIDRPFYVLESQPPRPSTELLSMILFGGRVDAMSDENLRSIEDTRAAMVDGAIGLVSMFYLASTPIDSVGYNPHTGIFRARVQLAQGTSLFIGSDLEGSKQSIGLRRRLTENWSFETGAETSDTEGKHRGLAMFRWGRRY